VNPAVVDRLVREEGVDEETAERWFDEMLRFLDVCATSATMLSPSENVDRAWHAFILNTRDYERYCRDRFGHFVHHDPTGSPDPDAYARAYERVAERHGQLDPAIWPVPLVAGAVAASGEDDDEHDGRARCSGTGGGGACGAGGDGAHDTGGGGCSGGGASCGASCGGGGCGGGA
jgi:hypothetical protein